MHEENKQVHCMHGSILCGSSCHVPEAKSVLRQVVLIATAVKDTHQRTGSEGISGKSATYHEGSVCVHVWLNAPCFLQQHESTLGSAK